MQIKTAVACINSFLGDKSYNANPNQNGKTSSKTPAHVDEPKLCIVHPNNLMLEQKLNSSFSFSMNFPLLQVVHYS